MDGTITYRRASAKSNHYIFSILFHPLRMQVICYMMGIETKRIEREESFLDIFMESYSTERIIRARRAFRVLSL
jgi:hypothetical protein